MTHAIRLDVELFRAKLSELSVDLLICMRTGGDLAAELLTVHGKLEALANEAEELAGVVLREERG